MSLSLDWLPECADWIKLLVSAQQLPLEGALSIFQSLAGSRMDFVRAARLDKSIQRCVARHGVPAGMPTLRFGLLGSSTVSHLIPGIRLGALRRGLWVEVYEGSYGLYRQELADVHSGLHAFGPDVVCLSLDADHLVGAAGANADEAIANLRGCWNAGKQMGAVVLQQTVLPRFPALMGNNEDRLAQSPATVVRRINHALRECAPAEGVYLLSVDDWAANYGGVGEWFDTTLWHSSKHEIHFRASDLYGDQVGRVLAALRGRSAKCLVLDLDNTLWGGVIGDDGVDGIALGQGSATGEAHLALQRYARQLAQRGVILAVCSKNDHANAIAPFERHPEMILKLNEISCFVANWADKAENFREIARRLNIGLDALVFVDDNPAERGLIRRELPMVAVPELPEDPAGYVHRIASAGYFEALDLTDEDRERTALYRAGAARQELRESATDMGAFLDSLKMRLTWSSFDMPGLKRIVQLINKTNQFNLTTQRYTEANVLGFMGNPDCVTLQLRLSDIYGENGVVALLIGHRTANAVLTIDTWLMSCRVLGREVEGATLNILAFRATELGCQTLEGCYRPTAKNAMVLDHYKRLGFEQVCASDDGTTKWILSLDRFFPRKTHMEIFEVSPAIEGAACRTPISIAS